MQSARDIFLSGDTWSSRVARLMIGLLIEKAIEGDRITYGKMAQLLQKRHRVPAAHAACYGRPAGIIGDVLLALSNEWGEAIPPLNAILVNQQTKVSGSGANYYLQRFRPGIRLTPLQRHELAEDAIDAVFDYPKLRQIADHFNIPLRRADPDGNFSGPIEPPINIPRRTGGEGEAHKSLKYWVMHNPKVFRKYGHFRIGRTEFRTESGDEIDVLFENDRSWLGVEVKASNNEAEMWRGMFQCIKYRALMRAMCSQRNQARVIQSILVVEFHPTNKIKQLAKRLNVQWINVARFR